MATVEESPALFMWMLLASPASFLAAYLMLETNLSYCVLLIAFGVLNLTALIFVFNPLFDWYDDITDDSVDWDDMDFGNSEDVKKSSIWLLVGLAGLLIISIVLGFIINQKLTFISCIWVPHDLTPLTFSSVPLLALLFSVLTTWFAVIPGEEGMKISFMVVNKAFPERLTTILPFALQIGRILGNVFWALLHVILGQNNFFFVFSVFIAGCLMDSVSAQSGTILNNYFIHGMFNTIVIISTFLFGGALTIIW